MLDAVRASMAAQKVKTYRTVYHAELLKLAAQPPGPENPKVAKARTDVRNLAKAAEAHKAKKGTYPETLAALKEAGLVARTSPCATRGAARTGTTRQGSAAGARGLTSGRSRR